MKQRVTLSQIAQMSGVSRQVVSAILTPHHQGNIRYSPKTYEKVTGLAKKLNFRVNRTAKNLVSKRHGSLGILIREFGMMWNTILQFILLEAQKYEQVIVLETLSQDQHIMPSTIREDAVDGLILFEDIEERIQNEVNTLGIPSVLVNTTTETVPGTIIFNEYQGMELAIHALRSLNHHNLALISSEGNHFSCKTRKEAFLNIAHQNPGEKRTALSIGSDCFTEGQRQKVIQEISEFLTLHNNTSGLILSEDRIAPLLYAASKAIGKSIPDELSVIGFNNGLISHSIQPRLSSVYVNPNEVGRAIVKKLNDIIEDKSDGKEALIIDYRYLPRESTVQ